MRVTEVENAGSGGRIIARCREVAACTDVTGEITRTFLSHATHDVHALLRGWMEAAGMTVRVDAVGNVRGLYEGLTPDAPRLLVGSHLDTIPNAGAFDGVLGVALVEELRGRRLPFAIEVIGFSEEEGVRFSKPFLGSMALMGIGMLLALRMRPDAQFTTPGLTPADNPAVSPHSASERSYQTR